MKPYKAWFDMSNDYPGEFEQRVLLVILELGDDAYGARVRERLTERVGREPAAGAFYTTLRRLEAKGWAKARNADGGADRAGRPRRYYRPTEAGLECLRRSRNALLTLWEPVAAELDRA